MRRGPFHPDPYTLDGVRVIPISSTCVVRSDGLIGRKHAWEIPETLAEVNWYTPAQVCARAGIDADTLKARLRDRWTFADLVKPPGRERLVQARRKGVPVGNGKFLTLAQACKRYGISKTGIEYRILQGWPWAQVIAGGRTEREDVDEGVALRLVDPNEPGAPGLRKPRDTKASRAMYSYVRFVFAGAMDTLPGHCKARGMNPATVRSRLRSGCTLDEALSPGRLPRSDIGKPNPARGYREGHTYG
jgi:hypothetical protein